MENGRPAAFITGIGVVSPIGVGRKQFWSSLLANESGAGPITLFDPDGFEVRIAAECRSRPRSFVGLPMGLPGGRGSPIECGVLVTVVRPPARPASCGVPAW